MPNFNLTCTTEHNGAKRTGTIQVEATDLTTAISQLQENQFEGVEWTDWSPSTPEMLGNPLVEDTKVTGTAASGSTSSGPRGGGTTTPSPSL